MSASLLSLVPPLLAPTDATRVMPLRLRPAPVLDGPYDDERPEPPPFVAGSLALDFPPPVNDSVPLRLVPPAGAISDDAPRCQRDRLPNPGPWTLRLAQAVAEVLAGARPPSQLGGVATLDVLALLERNAGRLGARPGTKAQRPVVGSVHISEPRDGVAEACAVVDTGVRKRALALRLEGIEGQWRCTALQIG